VPLFEYTCKKCNSDFELLIRGDEVPECPGCGGRKLEKHLSAPAAHVAGGGNLPVCEAAQHGGCGAMPEGAMGQCPMQ